MSRSAEPQRPAGAGAGFSLIEIVVSLGILSLILVAVLPQLVVGIQATDAARGVSQAKGVAQGQLERMRHLPFHIARDAGDYRDVLDYYFRNLNAGAAPACTSGSKLVVPTAASTGYVAPGSTRCSYEPSSGAFYRTVTTTQAVAGMSGYTTVIDAQFLSGATPPVAVTPPVGYNSQTTGKDSPAAAQLGVTVTVLQHRRGLVKPITSYTQIAKRLPSTSRVRSEADARVLDIGSVKADRVPVSLSAGVVNLAAGVSFASTAAANLAATTAGLATGETGEGASRTLSAPPAVDAATTVGPAGTLAGAGCAYACWGASSSPQLALTAANGIPTVGSSTAPAQVLLADTTNDVLSFGNAASDADYKTELKLDPPLVRMDTTAPPVGSGLSGCAVGAGGASAYVSAGGYLTTTSSSSTSNVESCVVGRATAVELFPTTFAPHGVVKLELTQASVQCLVQGSTHTATVAKDYAAVVSYWDGNGYTTAATVAPGQTTDALDSVPLTTSVGGGMTLGDYISSWSALTSDQVVTVSSSGLARVQVPGVVKIVSQPVRALAGTPGSDDDTSAVSLTVGALSCKAQDAR